jgi:flagellar motor switch/type III secretory pathway protein FliN
VVTAWAADWLADGSQAAQILRIAGCPLAESAAMPTLHWRAFRLHAGELAWVASDQGNDRELERLIFRHDTLDASSERHLPSTLAADTAREAHAALLTAVLGAFGQGDAFPTAPAPVPTYLFKPGAGSVLLQLSLDAISVRFLLPAKLLPALAVSAPPVTMATSTLVDALARTPVDLTVELARPQLTLGYLQTLAVGDVLALPTHLDEVLRVDGPGSITVCGAHLGQANGQRAIELIRNTLTQDNP